MYTVTIGKTSIIKKPQYKFLAVNSDLPSYHNFQFIYEKIFFYKYKKYI